MIKQTKTVIDEEADDFTMHTCTCGEQHRHRPGSPSQREVCTSEKKNTDSCCCGSSQALESEPHSCGHSPRCR